VQTVLPALPCTRVPGWRDVPDLVHGFCGRRGGVSRAPYADFNLSRRVGDDPRAVAENWRRLAASIRGRFASMRQVHGTRVATVTATALNAGAADAMATAARGVVLGVLTADCVPLLLLAPEHGVIAAVHAGWRGTAARIGARAVAHLQRHFGVPPAALRAALGPAIGGCCYEVDADIAARLEAACGAAPGALRRAASLSSDKAFVDLRTANALLLERAGVPAARIVSVGPCTRCAGEAFFSHRAAATTGRQISFIGWRV
jgi:YfiH family protein